MRIGAGRVGNLGSDHPGGWKFYRPLSHDFTVWHQGRHCYLHHRSGCISPLPAPASKPRTPGSVSRSCRCFWMLRNLRRDRLRSLGGAAADPPSGPDDGRHRDALRYWAALDQRDDLGRPSDRARATSMSGSQLAGSIPNYPSACHREAMPGNAGSPPPRLPGASDINRWNVWTAVVEEERAYIDKGAFQDQVISLR